MNQVFLKLTTYTMVQILSFGVVISMIFYFTMFDDGRVLQGEIANLTAELQKEQNTKAETERLLQEEARMKEALAVLSQQYQELSRRLPTSLSSIELNRNVDAFARNAGVSVKSRRPIPVRRGEIVEEVPLEVTLQGTFAELAQFVYVISASERVTAVQQFSITPQDKSNQLNFQGVIVGYQLAPERPDLSGGAQQ